LQNGQPSKLTITSKGTFLLTALANSACSESVVGKVAGVLGISAIN
jgi:hypothetical protein